MAIERNSDGAFGSEFADRVRGKFGFSMPEREAQDDAAETETAEEDLKVSAENGGEAESDAVEAKAPEVETSAEESEEVEVEAEPESRLDPNIVKLVEQNKILTQKLGESLPKTEDESAAPQIGLTADLLMDEEVRKDPKKFAEVINRAAAQIAEQQAKVAVQRVEAEQSMTRFRNEFYQRPENKRFAALRDTAFDPLSIAARELATDAPHMRDAGPKELMEELTRRVGKMGELLKAAGYSGEAPKTKTRVNQPGAKPSTTHAGPSEENDVRGSRKDPDRTRAGLREYFESRGL